MKLLPLLLAGLAPLAVSAAEEAVAVRVTTDKVVEIAIGDRPFAVYRPNVRGRLPKPFLLPVFAADGTVLTRPLENPEDHPHHKGVWVAVDQVNGVDFWAEKGRIVTQSIAVEFEATPVIHVINSWQSLDGKPVVDEDTRMTFFPNGMVIYDIRFRAAHGPVEFGDTKEGLFGFRMANSLREKETGKVINADGLQGSSHCWGRPSAWVDYFGTINNSVYGVALFDHPQNFRPSRYHVRNYGLFSISPFGESAYTKGERPAAPVKLEPGKTLRLQYAVYFHNGNTQVGRVGDVYQQFLRQTREVVDSGNQP